jgi:hypothetical protein
LQDGRRAVRALSWAQLDRILDDLAALKVYDPAIVLGSSFKIEDENFDPAGHRHELFLAVAQLAYPGMLRCCEAPRPSCLLFKDLAAWAEQDWRCLSCDQPIDPYLADTELSIFKMHRRVVANLAQSIELKRLPASGAESTPETMRGLTIPRPVHAISTSHLGKEVIVDPTDTSEDLTAEELNATEPVIYRDEGQRIDDLRARVREAGVKRVGRLAIGVSLSTIQRFVNRGTKLHATKLSRIQAALQVLSG